VFNVESWSFVTQIDVTCTSCDGVRLSNFRCVHSMAEQTLKKNLSAGSSSSTTP